ncbi:hypothetical protein, partial [Citrobacter freundii]|uniref:hypothetical protein n=1 Tax=Citrobacter freundii TaxID=546 RepID=UPI00195320C8
DVARVGGGQKFQATSANAAKSRGCMRREQSEAAPGSLPLTRPGGRARPGMTDAALQRPATRVTLRALGCSP